MNRDFGKISFVENFLLEFWKQELQDVAQTTPHLLNHYGKNYTWGLLPLISVLLSRCLHH
jgi:hypothetical protein